MPGSYEPPANDDKEDKEARAALFSGYADRLRAALDKIRWQEDGGDDGYWRDRDVHFFAVLLLELRFKALVELARVAKDEDPPDELVKAVGQLVDWYPREQELRPRPELPTLAKLWEELCKVVGERRAVLHAADLCRVIWGEVTEQRLACWYKWVQHAKERAQDRLDEPSWRELFSKLLPRMPLRGRRKGR
ncbi:MAG: hypothetical protein HY744_27585 [Deltaproteobacteria bacterium]|nr:hypothetical protein [Deltaproteobacteria bacterium]